MKAEIEQKTDTAQRSIFSAFVGTSLSSILVTVLTFLSGVLIARTLGPEGRGDYGAVLLFAQTAAGLGCLSFFDASVVQLQRRGGNLSDMLPTMMVVALTITAIATGSMMVAIPLLDIRLTEISLKFVAAVSLLVIATQIMIQCFSALERSQLNFLMINIERVGAPTVFSLMIVAASLYSGSTLTATLAAMLFVVSKVPIIVVWIIRYKKNLIGHFSWDFTKKTMATGLKFHFAIALGVIASQLDRLIAVAAWPKDLLGHYFVAFSAVGAGYSVITTALNTVLLPYLSSLAAKDRQQKIGQIIRLMLFVTVVTVLAGWLIIPQVLPLLYGAAYTPAVDLALWLLFALCILPLRAIVLEAGRSLGKGRSSIEMATTSIATMYAGYLVTGLTTPRMLIAIFGLSHLLSMLVGARHMIKDGDIRLDNSLVPSIEDLYFIRSIFHRLTKGKNYDK